MKTSRKEFTEKVMDAKVDEIIPISHFPYKNLHFDFEKDTAKFSWVAEREHSCGAGYVFPGNGNTVQTFKTLNGAKRNMIKHFGHLLD